MLWLMSEKDVKDLYLCILRDGGYYKLRNDNVVVYRSTKTQHLFFDSTFDGIINDYMVERE